MPPVVRAAVQLVVAAIDEERTAEEVDWTKMPQISGEGIIERNGGGQWRNFLQ